MIAPKPQYDIDTHQGWYCIGDAFYNRGEFRKAKEAYKKALTARPGDRDTLWAIADCCSESGMPRVAERYYRKARLSTRGAEAWNLTYNIANSLFDQRRYGQAIALYCKIPSSDAQLHRRARKNMRLAQDRRMR